MQTAEWGPPGWHFLHSVTFGYPENPNETEKQNYKNFFDNVQYVLPCKFCKTSYVLIYKYIDISPYLESRNGLTFWLFIIHNLVNRKLKKKLEVFENVVVEYENLRAKCGKNDNSQQFKQCKAQQKIITTADVRDSVDNTVEKYKNIARKQIQDFYNSSEIIDPKIKCDHI